MSAENPIAKKPTAQGPTLEDFKLEEFDLRRRDPESSVESSDKIAVPSEQSGRKMPGSEKFDPKALDTATIDRVLEMAWEDRTPFGAIEVQFGLKEQDVIEVMRRYMKRSSFKMWRKRVTARKTKHAKKREFDSGRFKSSNQKNY
ncbi:MAG: TIGR03643 family protein [Phormidesmis sp.]